jgi:hypothetical protein
MKAIYWSIREDFMQNRRAENYIRTFFWQYHFRDVALAKLEIAGLISLIGVP